MFILFCFGRRDDDRSAYGGYGIYIIPGGYIKPAGTLTRIITPESTGFFATGTNNGNGNKDKNGLFHSGIPRSSGKKSPGQECVKPDREWWWYGYGVVTAAGAVGTVGVVRHEPSIKPLPLPWRVVEPLAVTPVVRNVPSRRCDPAGRVAEVPAAVCVAVLCPLAAP
jgi:hypothetical protein